MICPVLFQRGATGWGFQVYRLYGQINFPAYWFRKGHRLGRRLLNFGYIRIQPKEGYHDY